MQHALTCPPPECSDSGNHPTFNVLIAYEDLEMGKHAKKTYDFLVDQLGNDCQFNNQMWKFGVLSIPKLREIAAADAAAADIVVISCHGGELPDEVKAWFNLWVNAPDGPLALVALFDSPADAQVRTREARAYLAQQARRGHMEFFAQPDEWPGSQEHRFRRSAEIHDRALSTLAGAVRAEPAVRWTWQD